MARKWRRRKEREADRELRPEEALERDLGRLPSLVGAGRVQEASHLAAEIDRRMRSMGRQPTADMVDVFAQIHLDALEIAGPSSPEGQVALERWKAAGGGPLEPLVARLAEAWRAGGLDPALVPEDAPEPARGLLRFACEALLSRESLPDATRFRSETKRRFGSVAHHLPDLFRAWLCLAREERSTLQAGFRKALDDRPMAAALACLACDKPNLLWRLPAEDGRLGIRESVLIALAQDQAGLCDCVFEGKCDAALLAEQYSRDRSEKLLAAEVGDLPETLQYLLEEDPSPDDLGRLRSAGVESIRRAIESGRLDVVHALCELLLRYAGVIEPALLADLERLRDSTGFLTRCTGCAPRAQASLLDRLAKVPEADRDRKALCRAIVQADAWPPGLQARALALLAADGEPIDPETLRRVVELAAAEGQTLDPILIERLAPGARTRQRIDEAFAAGGDVHAALARVPEIVRTGGARSGAEGLGHALRRHRLEETMKRGMGRSGDMLRGRDRPRPLRPQDVLPHVEAIASEAAALDLPDILPLLASIRGAFGTGPCLDRARSLFRSRIAEILSAGVPEPAGLEGAMFLVSAGFLAGREETIQAGTRALRRVVSSAADPATKAQHAWTTLLALEGCREAYPAESERVDAWQRSFLNAITGIDRTAYWRPLVDAPGPGDPVFEGAGPFLARWVLTVPNDPEAAAIQARHHLMMEGDLAAARRWLAEARKRRGRRKGSPALEDLLESVQEGIAGVDALRSLRPEDVAQVAAFFEENFR